MMITIARIVINHWAVSPSACLYVSNSCWMEVTFMNTGIGTRAIEKPLLIYHSLFSMKDDQNI